MKRKIGLLIILSVFYAISVGWYYIRIIKKKELYYQNHLLHLPAISSNFSDSDVTLQKEIAAFRSSILNRFTDNTILEIKVFYDLREFNNTSYENMGLARAHAVREILDAISEVDIRLTSQVIELSQDTQHFESVVIEMYTRNEYVEENGSGAVLFTSFIDEDSVDISTEIDAYLTYLTIEERDKAVNIIGHYYSEDSTDENYTKGLLMASLLRQNLINRGMKDYQMSAKSEGNASPLNGIDSIDRLEIIIMNNHNF